MSMEVKVYDNSMQVCGAIESAITAALHEAGGEFVSQAVRNSRRPSGDTAKSFDYKIDGNTLYVGSSAENAIWEEFGTGTYAEEGGRSGYWVFVKGSGGKKSRSSKSYTLEEAKRIMAMLRRDGLEAYYTNGKRGTRALTKAMQGKARKAEDIVEKRLGAID